MTTTPREHMGGTAKLSDTSITTTATGPSPPAPGTTHEFWGVGHNVQGDSPESNHVTYVAT